MEIGQLYTVSDNSSIYYVFVYSGTENDEYIFTGTSSECDKFKAEKNFRSLVDIYDSTGKCFTFWKDNLTTEDRKDIAKHVGENYSWPNILRKISISSSLQK